MIQLYGAPGVGKSSIAIQLSYRLDLPVISTDTIRSALRSACDVWNTPLYTPNHLLWQTRGKKYSRTNMILAYKKLCESMRDGVDRVILDEEDFGRDFILEGANFQPEESAFLLIVKDEADHLSRFRFRKHQVQVKNHFKAIRDLQDYLIRRAKERGIPIVNNQGKLSAMAEILRLMKVHD